jgi:nitrilase
MFLSSLVLLLGAVTAVSTAKSTPDYNNLTVAIVRAEPVNWPMPLMNKNWTGVHFDLNSTIAKGVKLIEDAASNGANLVVFPELWFPGYDEPVTFFKRTLHAYPGTRYPKGIADNVTMAPWLANYIENSLTINSTHWQSLINAATNNKIYISPAFSHKDNGALYLGQALISPDGTFSVRHKLRPSGGERSIWSDGTTEDLKVIATPYGRWGILECWEHFHPAMTFNTQAQAETLHIAAWPCTFPPLLFSVLAN